MRAKLCGSCPSRNPDPRFVPFAPAPPRVGAACPRGLARRLEPPRTRSHFGRLHFRPRAVRTRLYRVHCPHRSPLTDVSELVPYRRQPRLPGSEETWCVSECIRYAVFRVVHQGLNPCRGRSEGSVVHAFSALGEFILIETVLAGPFVRLRIRRTLTDDDKDLCQ
jgi:hypothetical protein